MKYALVLLGGLYLFTSSSLAQITYPDSGEVQLLTDELFWDFDTRKNDVSPALAHGPDGGISIYMVGDSLYMTFGAPEATITYSAADLTNLKDGGTYFVRSSGTDAGTYSGSEDPNPGNFDYKIWPTANGNTGANRFTGNDGNLYRVQYQEFHGWDIDSLVNNNICPDPNVVTTLEGGLEKCWYNGFVLTKSTDGGDTWQLAGSDPADYVVASSPYKLQEQSNTTRHGVFPWNNADSYSKVFKVGSYFYFPVQFWGEGFKIATIMRTDDISDASSWRYWDGSDFTIENVNPYYDVVTNPASHLPPPIENSSFLSINSGGAVVDGLQYNSFFQKYIRIQVRAFNSNPEIIPGVYFHLSEDGFNWSGPQLLYRLDYAPEMNNGVEVGGRSENFAYPVLVDMTNPASDTLGQSIWMFYVTFNPANSGLPERYFRRVQVDFSTRSVSGFTVTHNDLNLPEDASPGDGYCDNGYGRCSLITAINESNNRPPWVSDETGLTINFDNSLSGTIVEDYASSVQQKLTIDGSSHSGFIANSLTPEQGHNGTFPFKIGSGLNFTGSGHTIQNLYINSINAGTDTEEASLTITGSRIDTLTLYGTTTSHNVIGGTSASEVNLIGTLDMFGTADTVKGNLIGFDGTASAFIDPSEEFINLPGSGNVIDRNVMGGTDFRGINITGADNIISNNYFGYAPWNLTNLGTGGATIAIAGTSGNQIKDNFIGFTQGEASIFIQDASENTIQGNYIGTNPNNEDLGASVSGIWVTGNSSNNLIGDFNGNSSNVIANNSGAGVDFNVNQGTGNLVTSNLIYDNDGGSIANYSHVDVLDPPTIYSAYTNASEDTLFLFFTDLDSLEDGFGYHIELFLADSAASNPQGNQFIGYQDGLTVDDDYLAFPLPGSANLATYPEVSITYSDPDNNTSVYSAQRFVLSPSFSPTLDLSDVSLATSHNDLTRVETINITLTNSGNTDLDWFLDNEQTYAFGEPDQGTVDAGDSVTVAIILDSRDINGSDVIRDTLYFRSNSVGSSVIEFPIEIDMTAISLVPMIAFPSDTLRFTYQRTPGDQTFNETFYVLNLGAGGLNWNINDNAPWIDNLSPSSGVLVEDDSIEISMDLSVGGQMQFGTYNAILVLFGNYGGDNTPFELFVEMTVTDQVIEPPVEPTLVIDGSDAIQEITADSIQVSFTVENFIVGSNPETSNGLADVFLNGSKTLSRNNTNDFFVHGLTEGLNTIVMQLITHTGETLQSAKDTLFVQKQTAALPPDTVTLLIPEKGEWYPIYEASFLWGSSEKAEEYFFQLSLENTFNEVLFDTSLTDTTFMIPNGTLLADAEHFWRVRAENKDGVSDWSEIFFFDGNGGLSTEDENIPTEYALSQNYPNPFNPETTIAFALPDYGRVTLTVYNSLGQMVSRLVNEDRSAGRYTIRFEASGLSSGIYYYVLETDAEKLTRKMTLIK